MLPKNYNNEQKDEGDLKIVERKTMRTKPGPNTTDQRDD